VTTADATRSAWATTLIERGRCTGPLARYGSPGWLALPDGPAKVASAVVAAEAWRGYCSVEQVEADMRASLDEIEQVIARRMKYASWDISRGSDWRRLAASPSFAELQIRRYGPAA
jgi:hypothetical protein